MPLSFGIPLGLMALVVGAILFFATNHKKIAIVICGTGALVVFLTFAVIVMAVNSKM